MQALQQRQRMLEQIDLDQPCYFCQAGDLDARGR